MLTLPSGFVFPDIRPDSTLTLLTSIFFPDELPADEQAVRIIAGSKMTKAAFFMVGLFNMPYYRPG